MSETKKITLTVDAGDEGVRLDRYLSDELEDYSRSYLSKIIKNDGVYINDKSCKPKDLVKAGDEITVIVPEMAEPEILAEDIPLDILYEDDDIIVVNKPKGMVVHPAAGHFGGTLVNALMFHCKDQLSGINGVARPGIVHRIDKDTTGVLVACKTDFAHRAIAEQLAVHSINRIYHCICLNQIKEETGTVDAPIARSKNDRKKMAIDRVNGRRAVTHYTVLENLGNYSYVACKLETGRTHQIRVHMSSIGHPLLGDNVYGSGKSAWNLQGQTLHAKVLGFIHPRTGEYMEFEAPLPEYFEKVLSGLRNRT